MAFSNVDPSKRDEFLAFASLVRSQTDIQQKLYSLETRSERSAYIKSLGFDPETLSSVINSIEFTFGDKRVTYEQWLQLKGVRNDTPLPLNVIVSAMRKSGFNNAYDQLSKEIEQYINELSGYSGGAGTSVKVTTTTRSPKTDTETIDISVDVKDVSDKGISEESQDFVVSDKNSETTEEGKAFDSSSEKFESTETSDSRNETTDSKTDQTIEINVTINEQVDKYSSEHSDLQSSYTSEQSAEISKEATNFKDSVNSLKEQYDKGEISKTDFISSLTAEANKSLDKAAEIAPQESKAYDELKDGIDEALKAAESENITKGTDEGDESGDKDSDSDKDSGSNDSSSDSIIKGLKDPDMWIGAIVGAVGIEALKKGSEVLYNLYKDNS